MSKLAEKLSHAAITLLGLAYILLGVTLALSPLIIIILLLT